MSTLKLFYNEMNANKVNAKIVNVDADKKTIILDRTIAYPEGGGQLPDNGIISHNGNSLGFSDVQKRNGRVLLNDDFPSIMIETDVVHHIDDDDAAYLEAIKVGDQVTIEINIERREKLSVSHTASHILFMALEKVRPGITKEIIGCSIGLDSARFDFRLEDERVDQDELTEATLHCNDLINQNLPISLYPLEGFKDAWFWECDRFVIPCGGTHLSSTGNVGKVFLSRKSLGRGKDRVIIKFPSCTINTSKYREIA